MSTIPALLLTGLLLTLESAAAEIPAPPVVEAVYPAGGRAGSAFELEATGTWTAWPVDVWTATEGLRLTPTTTPGRFQVRIASTAVVGPTLLRFHHAGGATPPVQFVISNVPEAVETEERPAAAAGIPATTMTRVFHGRLLKADETDQWLLPVTFPTQWTVTLDARGLDAPLLASLRLASPTGRTLTMSVDPPGGDPRLTAVLDTPGLYRLEVFARSGTVEDPEGWVAPTALYRLEARGELIVPTPVDPTNELGPLDPNILRPETSANIFELPATVRGFISPQGDRDRYTISAAANEQFTFALYTTSIGSPLNGRLQLVDPFGEVLEEVTGPDPTLVWVAPTDGEYVLWVDAADNGGGSDCLYDLELSGPQLFFEARLDLHTLRLLPGESTNLTVTSTASPGHGVVLNVSAQSLPPGVRVGAGVIVPGTDRVQLRLEVADDAPPANQPFRITLLAADPRRPQVIDALAPIQGRHAGPDTLLVGSTRSPWLTVLPRPSDD